MYQKCVIDRVDRLYKKNKHSNTTSETSNRDVFDVYKINAMLIFLQKSFSLT